MKFDRGMSSNRFMTWHPQNQQNLWPRIPISKLIFTSNVIPSDTRWLIDGRTGTGDPLDGSVIHSTAYGIQHPSNNSIMQDDRHPRRPEQAQAVVKNHRQWVHSNRDWKIWRIRQRNSYFVGFYARFCQQALDTDRRAFLCYTVLLSS